MCFDGRLRGDHAEFIDVQGCKFGIGPCERQIDNNENFKPFYCDTLEVGRSNNNNVIATINGIIVANNINPISDFKLKKNIYKCPYSSVDLPDVVSYSYINDEKRKLGFIAQDLEALFPEAIIESKFYKMMFKKPKAFNCISAHKKSVLNTNNTNYHLDTNDFIIINNRLISILECTSKEITIDYETYEDILYIDGIMYESVKMIDYSQVLMILVQQVKELKSLVLQKNGSP